MRSINSLSWLSVLASLTTSVPAVNAQNNSVGQWPLHDNGLNDVVQWDHYSFKVNGKRLFVFSGEIHYWRIPVPEIWEDLLEKIKAAGFTAFAFYGNWGYHSANNGTVDFDSPAHDFTKLYEIAERVGLYVITRPGPYVNAEVGRTKHEKCGLDADDYRRMPVDSLCGLPLVLMASSVMTTHATSKRWSLTSLSSRSALLITV